MPSVGTKKNFIQPYKSDAETSTPQFDSARQVNNSTTLADDTGGNPGYRGDPELAGVAKQALMDRARELGAPTRIGQGRARTWRSMIDVQRDCEQKIAGQSSYSQALPREEAPISVESSSADSE